MKKQPFRGLGAILFKEFIVVWRDPIALFFMFFPPLVQIIAFGFALDPDVKHMPTALLNQDRTFESRQLVDEFVNTQTFRIVKEVHSIAELAETIRRGDAYLGIEIPPEFTRDLRAGRTAYVQLLIDGSNSTTALQALNTGIGVTFNDSLKRLLSETGRSGLPVEVRPQVLYNPALKSPNFFVPGVIGVALQLATVFATALSLVREREKGTLEQLLVSPLSRWGLMLGKIVPYLCIAMAMAALLFAILRWIFFVPIQGSLVALLVASFLYIFALLSLGLLISTRAQTQMEAFQLAMVFLLPGVFFSGFIFPRETMPWIFYAIGACLPVTYFIELMRAIILRGATLAEFWSSIVVLAVMGAVLFSLCALRFRKKIG
jgi:ABC-2 type transport system permease protein